MSKHTPGPWAIEKCPKAQAVTDGRDWPWLVNYNDGDYEGYVALVQTQNAEANARLISAAPEMLEALEMVLRVIGLGNASGDSSDAFEQWSQEHEKMVQVVRCAIKKVRGEE